MEPSKTVRYQDYDGSFKKLVDLVENLDGSYGGKNNKTGVRYFVDPNTKKYEESNKPENPPTHFLKMKSKEEPHSKIITGLFETTTKKSGIPCLVGKDKDTGITYYVMDKIKYGEKDESSGEGRVVQTSEVNSATNVSEEDVKKVSKFVHN